MSSLTIEEKEEDLTFLEDWKRLWLKGSFRSYLARGSEPIVNVQGKIMRAVRWGLSDSEMRGLLDQALTEAYRPDRCRYEEIHKLFHGSVIQL